MFKKNLTIYLIKLIALSISMMAAGYILTSLFGAAEGYKHLLLLVATFLVINYLAHVLYVKNSQSKPARFVRAFMIISVAKILLYLIVLITYILTLNTGLKLFLIMFLITYLAFTIFEVLELSKFLKNSNSK